MRGVPSLWGGRQLAATVGVVLAAAGAAPAGAAPDPAAGLLGTSESTSPGEASPGLPFDLPDTVVLPPAQNRGMGFVDAPGFECDYVARNAAYPGQWGYARGDLAIVGPNFGCRTESAPPVVVIPPVQVGCVTTEAPQPVGVLPVAVLSEKYSCFRLPWWQPPYLPHEDVGAPHLPLTPSDLPATTQRGNSLTGDGFRCTIAEQGFAGVGPKARMADVPRLLTAPGFSCAPTGEQVAPVYAVHDTVCVLPHTFDMRSYPPVFVDSPLGHKCFTVATAPRPNHQPQPPQDRAEPANPGKPGQPVGPPGVPGFPSTDTPQTPTPGPPSTETPSEAIPETAVPAPGQAGPVARPRPSATTMPTVDEPRRQRGTPEQPPAARSVSVQPAPTQPEPGRPTSARLGQPTTAVPITQPATPQPAPTSGDAVSQTTPAAGIVSPSATAAPAVTAPAVGRNDARPVQPGGLAVTGMAVVWWVMAALLCTGIGVLLVVARRRPSA